MRAKLGSPSYRLLDVEPGCCALCKSKLPLEGIQYTDDFVFFVRHGHLAHFTMIESRVLRALFKTSGFRLSREQLVASVYTGVDEPNNGAGVIAVAISDMRSKLLPLGMGVLCDGGIFNLVFTPPGYRRVAG